MNTFSLPTPSDFHVHFREDTRSPLAVQHTSAQFAHAIAMPNVVPPITTVDQALAYQRDLIDLVPKAKKIRFMMTLYLTESTTPADIQAVADSSEVHALKLYPAGATTNSESGVTDLTKIAATLSAMEQLGVALLVHGEVTDPEVDIFDREAVFIEQKMRYLVKTYPKLKIVMEHITTREAAEFVLQASKNIVATITPQHLLVNRNEIFKGNKVNPHNFCLPILKAEEHRVALCEAVMRRSEKFFAGTDSAPHAKNDKECACGCAGCYTACNAVELYAEAFDRMEDLSTTETQELFANFMSRNGCQFYGLDVPGTKMVLERKNFVIPKKFDLDDSVEIVPFWAGERLTWSMA
jgi:dihydroorotase